MESFLEMIIFDQKRASNFANEKFQGTVRTVKEESVGMLREVSGRKWVITEVKHESLRKNEKNVSSRSFLKMVK